MFFSPEVPAVDPPCEISVRGVQSTQLLKKKGVLSGGFTNRAKAGFSSKLFIVIFSTSSSRDLSVYIFRTSSTVTIWKAVTRKDAVYPLF